MIDRRMINSFLVKYVNPNSPPQVKHQMLDAMSKILAFSMEEKQELGLLKKTSGDLGGEADPGAGGGFGKKFLDFLLDDDEDD